MLIWKNKFKQKRVMNKLLDKNMIVISHDFYNL